MSPEYQSLTNNTGEPVEWYVDLASYTIEAMTSEEAIEKAETMMREERLPEIVSVCLCESQERIPIRKLNTWEGKKREE